MVIRFRFGRLRIQKSRVKKEEDEVGRAAIAAFEWLAGGCEPRVLRHSHNAGATRPATTTQWSNTAAEPQGEVAITSTCDVRSCKAQDKQVIMLSGALVRRNGMIVDVSRMSLLPSPTRPVHPAARRLCSSQLHECVVVDLRNGLRACGAVYFR
ncbi:hypothetical protein MTO96_046330 [Rhipicephalus appendiculatus]